MILRKILDHFLKIIAHITSFDLAYFILYIWLGIELAQHLLLLLQINYNSEKRMLCLFQGIEGIGSIYTTSSSSFTYEDLKKNKCGALIIISHQNKKIDSYKIKKVLSLTVKEQDDEAYFTNFPIVSNFISDAKNSYGEHMSIIFFFAYLIEKYSHTLQQIEKIYERKFKKIQLNVKDFNKLKCYLNGEKVSSKELPKQEKENQSILEKRIKRINKEYSELTKKSELLYELKKKQNLKNPEKKFLFEDFDKKIQQNITHRKGLKQSEEISLKKRKSQSLYKKSQSTTIS